MIPGRATFRFTLQPAASIMLAIPQTRPASRASAQSGTDPRGSLFRAAGFPRRKLCSRQREALGRMSLRARGCTPASKRWRQFDGTFLTTASQIAFCERASQHETLHPVLPGPAREFPSNQRQSQFDGTSHYYCSRISFGERARALHSVLPSQREETHPAHRARDFLSFAHATGLESGFPIFTRTIRATSTSGAEKVRSGQQHQQRYVRLLACMRAG